MGFFMSQTDKRLTIKQQRFVEAYVETLNATEAAARAGYKGRNRAVLGSIGSENLKKPAIKAAIEQILEGRNAGQLELVSRLSDIATASFGDFMTVEHNFVQFDLQKAADAGLLHLIKSIHRDGKTGMITEIELHDPMVAIDKLLRAQGAYRDGLDITSNGQGASLSDAFNALIASEATKPKSE